jgi:dienelactone hydrolase
MTLVLALLGGQAAVGAQTAPAAGPAQPVDIPVQDTRTPALHAWWWAAPQAPLAPPTPATTRPAVILLHGCAGMLNSQGQPNERTRVYARLLTAQGWHVLALDSFSARGVREICTRSSGQTAAVTQQTRVQDVRAALQWLARAEGVDPLRLAVVGWSNGGSTVLELTHRSGYVAPQDEPAVRLAVAFYPGCAARQRQGYQPLGQVLLMVGLLDDWTPPQPCLRLASESVRVHAFAGAYHGFDSGEPVRFRSDIRLGVKPEGVHAGAHPEARQQAREMLISALQQALQ